MPAAGRNSPVDKRLAAAMAALLKGAGPVVRDSVDDLSPAALGFSLDEFLGPRVPIEDVTVALAGRAVPRDLYTQARTVDPPRRRQVVSRPKVVQQLASGRTVVVRNLDLHTESCGRLAAGLERQEGARVNCNLFLTQEGFRGFALHRDAYDTIVVQLAGTKRWRLFDRAALAPDVVVLAQEEEHQIGEPAEELRLAPGDLLFMRAGVPHQAIAEQGLSAHVNFTVVRPTVADALRQVVKLAAGTEAGREPLPPSYVEGDGEVTTLLAATLRKLAEDPAALSRSIERLHAAELGQHRDPQGEADLADG